MRIGLFFGSFNPPHVGHTVIAEYALHAMDADEVWMVVSPQNPFKELRDLLPEEDRLELVQLAIQGFERIKASDVEFDMPRPSYTIDTIDRLKQAHPETEFFLILGSDNIPGLPGWKEYDRLLEECPIAVYPRKGHEFKESGDSGSIQSIDAPLIELSSTYIRDALSSEKPCQAMMRDSVYQHILDGGFYSSASS